MRAVLVLMSCLLLAGQALASEGAKKLGEGPPTIEFNPMTVPVQKGEKIEYRLYSLRVELFSYMDMHEACKPVPKVVDAAINDFRSNPPEVTRTNKLDMSRMNKRMREVVLRFMNPKLVKRVWLEEGEGGGGYGGVADRLPNQCR